MWSIAASPTPVPGRFEPKEEQAWVNHSKRKHSYIVFKFDGTADFYQFEQYESRSSLFRSSECRWGTWGEPGKVQSSQLLGNITHYLSCPTFRIDYRLNGRQLIETDKMGPQRIYHLQTK